MFLKKLFGFGGGEENLTEEINNQDDVFKKLTKDMDKDFSGPIILNKDAFGDYKGKLNNEDFDPGDNLQHGQEMVRIQKEILNSKEIDYKIFNFELLGHIFSPKVKNFLDSLNVKKMGDRNATFDKNPINIKKFAEYLKKNFPKAQVTLNLSITMNQEFESKNPHVFHDLIDLAKKDIKVNLAAGNGGFKYERDLLKKLNLSTTDQLNDLVNSKKNVLNNNKSVSENLLIIYFISIKETGDKETMSQEELINKYISNPIDPNSKMGKLLDSYLNNNVPKQDIKDNNEMLYDYILDKQQKSDIHYSRERIIELYESSRKPTKEKMKKNFSIVESLEYESLSLENFENSLSSPDQYEKLKQLKNNNEKDFKKVIQLIEELINFKKLDKDKLDKVLVGEKFYELTELYSKNNLSFRLESDEQNINGWKNTDLVKSNFKDWSNGIMNKTSQATAAYSAYDSSQEMEMN